jgi:phosphopantetheine adenylyltransferase
MEQETYYIVQYNDRFGNGTDKNFEALVRSEAEFKKWLKQHNAERKEMGADRELPEEFDLIPISLFKP